VHIQELCVGVGIGLAVSRHTARVISLRGERPLGSMSADTKSPILAVSAFCQGQQLAIGGQLKFIINESELYENEPQELPLRGKRFRSRPKVRSLS
jgi:hypothetical protein